MPLRSPLGLGERSTAVEPKWKRDSLKCQEVIHLETIWNGLWSIQQLSIGQLQPDVHFYFANVDKDQHANSASYPAPISIYQDSDLAYIHLKFGYLMP